MSDLRIESRIGIAASTDAIWEVLTDFEGWKDWNPLYPRAAGEIRIGSKLDLDLAIPGRPVQRIQPTVLDWAPYDHLHWRLIALRGWVTTVRFLEIEELSPGSCIFSNGEIFSGFPVGFAIKPMRRQIREGFEAMNEALKARAEARWRASQGATT